MECHPLERDIFESAERLYMFEFCCWLLELQYLHSRCVKAECINPIGREL